MEWSEESRQVSAGSGGFLLFTATRERHEAVERELHGLRLFPMRSGPPGSRIIFFN